MTAVSQVFRALEEDLAQGCLNAYASVEGAPLPIPTAFIPPSGPSPTLDCGDLLIVQMVSLTSAFQGPPERCAIVAQVNLAVTITRCVANLTDWGTPASRAQLNEDGLSLADDVSTLQYGVTGACRAGLLWTSFANLGCESTRFRDWRPGASGDIAWWTWNIGVDLTSALTGGNDAIEWVDGDEILWEG